MNRDLSIIKESGAVEGFRRSKVLGSLISSGIGEAEAESIIDQVSGTIKPPLSTKKLFRAVQKYLRRNNMLSNMRYSLKKAIFDLGPTGYPFEHYISKVLESRGYKVTVGLTVQGRCVEHEVDVVAMKGNKCYYVECKFHHNSRTQSDVKTSLYVHSRFLDIRNAAALPRGVKPYGMLVTNTRFSSEAVKYAECVGLLAIGWKHPREASLEGMITDGRTYPVTVLPSVTRKNVQQLVENDIVTTLDVMQYSADELERMTGFTPRDVRSIKAQASELCG